MGLYHARLTFFGGTGVSVWGFSEDEALVRVREVLWRIGKTWEITLPPLVVVLVTEED